VNAERIEEALRILKDEGLRVFVQPEKLEILVGRLEISNEGRQEHGPISGNGTHVKIDGNDVSAMLKSVNLRCAVDEIVEMEIILGGIA
jgi:hypothetical protein